MQETVERSGAELKLRFSRSVEMKKIIFCLLFLVYILTGCGLNGGRSEISKEIGVNVSEGEVVYAS